MLAGAHGEVVCVKPVQQRDIADGSPITWKSARGALSDIGLVNNLRARGGRAPRPAIPPKIPPMRSNLRSSRNDSSETMRLNAGTGHSLC